MKLWFITKNLPTLEEKLSNVITVLPKKKYAGNYIYRHITATHLSHYLRWCENHNMDSNLMESVAEYVNTVWYDLLNDYALVKQNYSVNEVARALRMLSYSFPVDGEWETEDEMTNYREFVQAVNETQATIDEVNNG